MHPEQDDPKCKKIRLTCRACAQLPLDVDVIYARIYTQIMETIHDILVQLVDLDYGRNPDIGTLKKDKRGGF